MKSKKLLFVLLGAFTLGMLIFETVLYGGHKRSSKLIKEKQQHVI
ncbi:hypothetical protein [Oceanirhabdus sp. W0125-5]|nr:hypothetical protein [Oceanirhabdus sp. W0125-5]WBW94955.1 hypothetical protein OW730_14765 [Oceanirhabdus sp. W0125-5]